MLTPVNPTTGEALPTAQSLAPDAAHDLIAQVAAGFTAWRAKSIAERAVYLRNMATGMREAKSELAELMAREVWRICEQRAHQAHVRNREVATDGARGVVGHGSVTPSTLRPYSTFG